MINMHEGKRFYYKRVKQALREELSFCLTLVLLLTEDAWYVRLSDVDWFQHYSRANMELKQYALCDVFIILPKLIMNVEIMVQITSNIKFWRYTTSTKNENDWKGTTH